MTNMTATMKRPDDTALSAVPNKPPPYLARLEEPRTIDDVVHTLGQIVDWSIKAESHIGYFAALYKRITLAIRQAVGDGVFDNGRLIEELDVAFGRRYFNALNAYFYPDKYQDLTLPWGSHSSATRTTKRSSCSTCWPD